MSQQQQVFVKAEAGDVSQVARYAVEKLASAGVTGAEVQATLLAETRSPNSHVLAQRFYDALILPETRGLESALGALKKNGLSDSDIANDLVPQAARQLGKAWEADLIAFGAVTIGCSRLQSIVRKLSDQGPKNQIENLKAELNLLIITSQSAQHTLGAIVLARQLRFVGASVQLELGADPKALDVLSKTQQFDGVMISASKAESLESLSRLVLHCRNNWVNSKIFLGGEILEKRTDLAAATGTDYVTNDWHEAICLCT